MPRVNIQLLRSSNLARSVIRLLPVCKSVEQAQKEIRWIQNELPKHKFEWAIALRSRSYPLQYILGNQPFGDLDIICRPGVLIPRNDTEEWCFELIGALKKMQHRFSSMKVIDMCTGTGCIPLLIASESPDLELTGVDISAEAISLCKENHKHNQLQLKSNVNFALGDLFDPEVMEKVPNGSYDLVISNPPYIPKSEFNLRNGMERSVKKFEPRLALEGDIEVFDSLIDNVVLKSQAQGFIFELAGRRQTQAVMHRFENLSEWQVGYRIDSNGQYRNVLGWKSGSDFSLLKEMCTSVGN